MGMMLSATHKIGGLQLNNVSQSGSTLTGGAPMVLTRTSLRFHRQNVCTSTRIDSVGHFGTRCVRSKTPNCVSPSTMNRNEIGCLVSYK